MDIDREIEIIKEILAAHGIETFLAPVTSLDPELDNQPDEETIKWN